MHKTMHIFFFNFRNTPCNRHITKVILTKMLFNLPERDLKFKIILKVFKINLYLCNPPYFWILLLKIACF